MGGGMALTALDIVQRYYPGVEKVVDAKKGINVTVTAADCLKGTKKAPNKCALANAFQREKFEGAIISKAVSYLVTGNRAVRYLTPQSVAREIISFDRGQDFDPGDYSLSAPSQFQKLGQRTGGPGTRTTKRGSGNLKNRYHKTTGIRVL